MVDENTETAPEEEPVETPEEDTAADDAAQENDSKEQGGSSIFNGSFSYYFGVGKKIGKATLSFAGKVAKKTAKAFMEGYRGKKSKETSQPTEQSQPEKPASEPNMPEGKTPEQKDPLADLSPEKRTKIDKELAQLREFQQMDISQDMKDSFTRMFENELSAQGKEGFGLNEEQVKAIKEQNPDLFPKKEQSNTDNVKDEVPAGSGEPQDNSLQNEDENSKLDEAKKEGQKPKMAEPLQEQLENEHQSDTVNDNKVKEKSDKESEVPVSGTEASKTEETRSSESEVKTTSEPKKDPLAELNPETRTKLDKEISTLREFKEKSGNPKLYGEFSAMLEKSMAEKGKDGFGLTPEQIQAVKEQNPGLFPAGTSKKKSEQTKGKKTKENDKETGKKSKEHDESRKKDRGGRKAGKADKPKGRPTSAKERRAAKRMAQLSGRIPPARTSAAKPQQMDSNVMANILDNARQKD